MAALVRLVTGLVLCFALVWPGGPAKAADTAKSTVKAGQIVPLDPSQGQSGKSQAPGQATPTMSVPSVAKTGLDLPAPQAAPAAPAATQAKAQSGTSAAPSQEQPLESRDMSTTIKQPADFNECVRVALVQSPMLVRSALEIESKRLDVQDAWASFIPTISINTTYWFAVPTNSDGTTNKPYSINFATSQWNPLLSGFDVKAKKEMVDMAILGHLKVISEGLTRMASDFLQLSALAEQKDVVRKKMDMAKSNLEFFKTRLGLGQATQLDINIAETKIKMAKAEEDKVNAMRSQVMDDLKFLMGVPFVNKLDVDVAAAKKQILGTFSPADVTDDKVRAHSFDLRIAEYEKSLQRKSIGLSYVKLLPTFGFTFQTVDAFNSSNSSNQNNKYGFPFYPGINVSMPLDYWTKGRDISRQYKKFDQLQASTRAKEFELMASVQKAMGDYMSANSDWNLASSRMELAKLQDEQTEYRYKTGQADYDKFVADKVAYYEAWQKMLLDQVKRDVSLLSLKNLTGDLQKQYIDVASWEK